MDVSREGFVRHMVVVRGCVDRKYDINLEIKPGAYEEAEFDDGNCVLHQLCGHV